MAPARAATSIEPVEDSTPLNWIVWNVRARANIAPLIRFVKPIPVTPRIEIGSWTSFEIAAASHDPENQDILSLESVQDDVFANGKGAYAGSKMITSAANARIPRKEEEPRR
jgi:hypothetical protein